MVVPSIDAWRKMAASWLGSLGTGPRVVEFADIQVTTSPIWPSPRDRTFRAVNLDGQKLREMQNRLTWVLKYRPGGWKVVHQHTSAPLDPGHGQADPEKGPDGRS